jgi:hypothetical protein
MVVHTLDLERNMYGRWKTERIHIPFLAVNTPIIVNTYSRIIDEPEPLLILNLGRLFVYSEG